MTEANTITIQLSDNAARHIASIAVREAKPNAMLRISVEGGGCSGFQYKYEFVWNQEGDDIALEKHGAKVLIDSTSATFMQNTIIDFEDTLAGSSFIIRNPNTSAQCGCGNSFAV